MADTMDKREIMAASNKISMIWSKNLPGSLRQKIRASLKVADKSGQPLQIFFRADDIARINKPFSRLMHLFITYEMPLCLAVVPKWLDRSGWEKMQEYDPASPLWCWHQHGWSHTNHELQGKKCEFGESRDRAALHADLLHGKEHLDRILGNLFLPVFTPPWNRCSVETLDILAELGFLAVSRFKDAQPTAAGIVTELAVNVDLHTRRETDSRQDWLNLFEDMTEAAQSGRLGFMLHHQRMNGAAFDFLEILLSELRSNPGVICGTFRDLLREQGRKQNVFIR
ncbi:MAG: polysaccharide deacetylase family protein [Desulfobulbales bacterium]